MRWKGPLVFRGSDGPIARSDESAERATVAWYSLGKLRSTRILPPRTAPSRGGFPVRRPMSLTPGPVPAFANSRFPVFIDLGSPFLVACEMSIAAGRLLQPATRPRIEIPRGWPNSSTGVDRLSPGWEKLSTSSSTSSSRRPVINEAAGPQTGRVKHQVGQRSKASPVTGHTPRGSGLTLIDPLSVVLASVRMLVRGR